MKSNFLQFIIAIYLITIYACSGTKGRQEAHIIDVEAAVGTGAIHNASEYIKEFTYIPLETVQNSLIKDWIRTVLVENGKIYIHSAGPGEFAGNVTIFDMDGRYISTLDKKGRGPGEYGDYFVTREMDITPSGNILVTGRGHGIYEYDHNFKFIRDLKPKADPNTSPFIGWGYDNLVILKEGLYALNANDTDFETETRFFIIYDNSQKVHFSETIQRVLTKSQGDFLYTDRGYIQYLQDNKLSIYRPETDSIFSIDFENGYSKSLRYAFNLGKYGLKVSLKDALSKEEYTKANSNSILIKKILESDDYIFIEFNFNDFAPEPILVNPGTITRASGMIQAVSSYMDTRVYGIYDKRENKLSLLNQPMPGILGLKNDLDGGPPVFWPKDITSKKEMITYYTAMEMVELIEQGKVDKELFGNITENDNPILVIAKER